ncbi:YigZ family protein [Granulosicoccus antarcticus]|uniref:IMPACT family member YigZ n=1 Tax=Granulosicoccus antarcticus IMCC3135 TaxID=1192854 RepID=A0A2Z2NTT2_9GAMM|nr:YigZ family protein [Granulosicoccus antarcticus]ASJ71037.1 IMPACT family member YigZ [Granulosicoccus antarcticus IMCC3135]
MDRFLTPSSTQQFELIIKRSRFITSVGHVAGQVAARQFIEQCRTEMPDASHHCWAMVAGPPDDIYLQDQNDDGEPKGTAGKPILNVVQHSGLGNIVVVVTRYFGGIKLGAGGLVRAYSQSASQALLALTTRETFVRQCVQVELAYGLLDSLEHWLAGTDILIEERKFDTSVHLALMVPLGDMTVLQEKLAVLGGGEIIAE